MVDNLERDAENCSKYNDRFTNEQRARIVQVGQGLLARFGSGA
jgi:hypothetical protein